MNTHTAGARDTPRARIGLLLVHGIGEQRPGEFLAQFVDGFRLLLGHDRVRDVARRGPAPERRQIHAATIELDDRTVFLYEVHWADLIGDDLARGAFDPADLFVVTWLPWFNKLAGLPGFDRYTKRQIFWRTVRLVPLSVLFFFGYLGLRACPHVTWAWESLAAMVSRADRATDRRSSAAAGRKVGQKLLGLKHRRRVTTPLLDLERLEHRGWLDNLLDRFAGDVVNCVISMAGQPRFREDITTARSALRELLGAESTPSKVTALDTRLRQETSRLDGLKTLADRILSRFGSVASIAVEEDRCTELQVLGHSLGSFIAYQAMNLPGAAMPERSDADGSRCDSPLPRLTRFYTIGSPLQKLQFFWPGLVVARRAHPAIRAEGSNETAWIPADSSFLWENFYSVSDRVSGELRGYEAWGGVANTPIPGLGGVATAHIGYGGNRRFLCALASGLGAGIVEKPDPLRVRIAARVWSGLQAMLLPLSVAVVCTLGAVVLVGFGALAGAMLAGLANGAVRLIQLIRPDWASDWRLLKTFYWMAAIFGFSMVTLVSMFAPAWGRRVARIAVARHWRRMCQTGNRPHQ
jgi:hypothetical protein